jgi:hypothetical protein
MARVTTLTRSFSQVFFDLVRQVNKTAPSRRAKAKKQSRCCGFRRQPGCKICCCRIC